MHSLTRSDARARARRGRIAAAGLVAIALVTLTACSADSVTEQYLSGSNQGYIGADGVAVDEIAPDDRGDPVEWAGLTESGDELSSADVAGDVVVVNFWYAGCAPCRVEADVLESVWQDYDDQDVSFVGVNTYDQADTAKSFADDFGVTYPSVIDVNDGSVKLAFAAATPIQSTPTTLVLDSEGRVAVRIIGQVESASILSTLISDTLQESA